MSAAEISVIYISKSGCSSSHLHSPGSSSERELFATELECSSIHCTRTRYEYTLDERNVHTAGSLSVSSPWDCDANIWRGYYRDTDGSLSVVIETNSPVTDSQVCLSASDNTRSHPNSSFVRLLILFTCLASKRHLVLAVHTESDEPSPRSCSDNGKQDGSTTTNSTDSSKTSRDRVTTRRALRSRNIEQPVGGSNNSNDEDDNDDDDKRRNSEILSQCEAKSLTTIARELDQEFEDQLESNTFELPEQHHLQHNNQSVLIAWPT